MLIKYRIWLTPPERKQLQTLLRQKYSAALRQFHARILLIADEADAAGGWLDVDTRGGCRGFSRTVERTR